MTSVAIRPEKIKDAVAAVLGDKVRKIHVALGEVTVEVSAANYLVAMQQLRDAPGCQFEQLVDLCGVDYLAYADEVHEGARYCVVSHLLSVSLNQRLRVKAFWPEAGVNLTKARRSKLEGELERLAVFSGCERVEFLEGWERETLVPPSV